MGEKIIAAILGGDRRQEMLLELMRADGHDTYMINERENLHFIEYADLTVFPLPACRDDGSVTQFGLHASDIFRHMRQGTVAAGGRIPSELFGMAELRGVEMRDYTLREDFSIANAVATAEGAIGIAISETDMTLQGAKCLVIGYGRIGKLLARKLAALGANVTVSARKIPDISWINAEGHKSVYTSKLTPIIDNFNIIFNTVPSEVIGAAELLKIHPSALIIDLASKPGGVDFGTAEKLGRRVIWALSLPAKIAPRSAAVYVRDSLYNIMEEINEK